MCGIAGILCKEKRDMGNACMRMADRIAHRGPDDFGYIALDPGYVPETQNLQRFAEGAHKVFLAHRRLSIIDLQGSRQPLSNEDYTVWTVFNGEIYNYCEIRNELAVKGHILKNNGDTEVLVHLWEEYQENMLEKLIGMFAFAIYDSKRDILFLARDRFGQKPLYYMRADEYFAFASEIQGFCHLPEFKNLFVNKSAIAQYFRYGFVPSPNTIYERVRTLSAGTFLICKENSILERRYWKPELSSEENAVDIEKIQSAIDDSVRLRLRADVPLGSFLSGGVDSALITASMTRQLKEPPQTFTVETDSKFWEDESEMAMLTANYLQTNHHRVKIEPDLISASEKLAIHYGQPFADHSAILVYYISREARKYLKVALTGDGGDEIFAGYSSYTNIPAYSLIGLMPFQLRKIVANFADYLPQVKGRSYNPDALLSAFSPPDKGENIASLFHFFWRIRAYNPEFLRYENENIESIALFTKYFKEAKSANFADKWMEADQRLYLCDDILVKLDIASMASALECRSPFLDHRLAEFANKIPAQSKMKHGIAKYILRKLAERQLPEKIARLPKKGFSMPLAEWIKNELKDYLHSLIFSSNPVWKDFLKPEAVKQMWQAHISSRADHHGRLWQIGSLELWKKKMTERCNLT